MTIIRSLILAACVAAGGSVASARAGGYRYFFVTPPDQYETHVTGLNDYDEVVGYFSDSNNAVHGFVLSHGVYTVIDAHGGTLTRLYDINRRGVAVGTYQSASGQSMLFTYDTRTGAQTSIASPDPRLVFGAATINAAGVIAGSLTNKHQGNFTYLHNSGGLRIIARPPGSHGGYQPTAINDTAMVVGTYDTPDTIDSFVFKAGVSKVFPINGSTGVQLDALSDAGVVGGAYFDQQPNVHGFTSAAGVLTTYDFPGGAGTYVAGITGRGDVVGGYYLNGNTTPGFVFSGGSYYSFHFPKAARGQLTIGKVNASGTLIGSLDIGFMIGRQFVAVCRRDQIPCTH